MGTARSKSPHRRPPGMAPGTYLGDNFSGEWPRRILKLPAAPPWGRTGGSPRGNRRPPIQRPCGLSAQRGGRFPVGLVGHGLPVGGHFVSIMRGKLACPCPNQRHVHAGTPRREKGHRATCESGPVPLLRPPRPYRRPSSIGGRGVSPGKGARTFAADGTWPLVGAIFRSAPLCAATGRSSAKLGLGSPIVGHQRASPT